MDQIPSTNDQTNKGGGGSWLNPTTAALILGGVGGLQGYFQGKSAQKNVQQQTALEELLGMRGLDIQSAAVGDQIRRQFETMPTRDRVLAQLQARLGQSPGRFNPSGLFQNASQPASQGGVDMGALQKAVANYTPGSGGTRPDLAASMLGKLGYAPQGGGTGNPWQQQLTQGFQAQGKPWAQGSLSGNFPINFGQNTNLPPAFKGSFGPLGFSKYLAPGQGQ